MSDTKLELVNRLQEVLTALDRLASPEYLATVKSHAQADIYKQIKGAKYQGQRVSASARTGRDRRSSRPSLPSTRTHLRPHEILSCGSWNSTASRASTYL